MDRDQLRVHPDGAVLGGVFAVLLAFTACRIADTWGGGYWQFGCAAGAVVCGLALVRRRRRASAAAGGLAVATGAILVSWYADLPAEPGPAMALALSVLVGSAVSTLPAVAAGAIAAGGLAVAAGSLLTSGVPASALPPVTMLNAGGWIAGVTIGLSSRLLAARNRTIAGNVRRHERLQLARELHDVVAHHVTGIVLQAQAAQVLARKQPGRLDSSLTGIETAGTDALAATRRLVTLLREAGDSPTPHSEGLADLAARFDGPAIRLRLPEDEPDWPPEVTSTVYRVVQESLTNVSRHAWQARSVHVTVARNGDAVTVEVSDDGAPVPARHQNRRGAYGLLGMRERLEALGGTLHAGPRPGNGWTVLATLPLPGRREHR
ncbi:sensor histidine kinase [Nonomuraea sp. NBC_00507]|uniref:sensor histidine kinase n=1 Tax=Nonomuraea sp. NBC_00507 TaxID=2976002 RepID=UPI002E16C88D